VRGWRWLGNVFEFPGLRRQGTRANHCDGELHARDAVCAVGAGGLGLPIISGIRSFDTALVLRGSIPVALLALFADTLFRRLERRAQRR